MRLLPGSLAQCWFVRLAPAQPQANQAAPVTLLQNVRIFDGRSASFPA